MTGGAELLTELAKRKSPHGRVMAVSMMKDEAPYLLEWVAHHVAVGFTDILVYTNDCSDGTVEMLQRLEVLGLCYHRENVIPEGHKPQPSALNHAQAEPLVQSADWVLVFDADEFLAISHPTGTVDGMITDAVERGANGIVITWRIFGSGGVVEWSRAPVTEQYLRAAPPLWNKGWGVKTLFKFDPDYWKLGIHRPSIKNKWLETDFPDTVKWLNGSGLPMEDYFKFRGWRSIRRTLGYDWAQMNHYAVKSVDAYAIRKFRGNVNNKKDKYNADYWSLQDRNEVEDRAILRHAEERRHIMAALLADPILRDLHEAALARLEARLAEYKQTEAYTTLRDSLIAASAVPITQVEAKPPQARDPAKIAALMSRVEKSVADQPKEERRNDNVAGWAAADGYPYVQSKIDLSADVAVDWIANHDLLLPADPRLFAPEALSAILTGRFERRHARNATSYAEGAMRLLELGAGVGFIALKLARDLSDTVIMAQETRPELAQMAMRVAEKNALANSAKFKLVAGDLVFDTDRAGAATGLAAYLHDFRPDTLRINHYADLDAEALKGADLTPVTRVILPFESDARADLLRQGFGAALLHHGFVEDEARAHSGSLLYQR
ncbi:glycosyltransferase family 2 protein [Rhodobacteraceae bacterium XHP0102]|nr:glycosyltransferase family 2 protein [Rhodobacteraceae bacterium XHP0102]